MTLSLDQRRQARTLLDEGCSIRETARTIGASRTAVGEAFPGRGWTYAQAGQFRAATRDWAAERAGRGAPLLLRVGES